jgi:hypothetical protein
VSPVRVLLAWRRSSARCGGEGTRGSDCFFICLLEGLAVIPRVFSAFSSFFSDPFVICTPTAYKRNSF